MSNLPFTLSHDCRLANTATSRLRMLAPATLTRRVSSHSSVLKRLLAGLVVGSSICAALIWGTPAAHAASINAVKRANAVNLQGTIQTGDQVAFARALVSLDLAKPVTVILNSDGGDVHTTDVMLGMLTEVVEGGGRVDTYVGKTDQCASACVLLWAYGAKKMVVFGGQLYVHAAVEYSAELGIDAPGRETDGSLATTMVMARYLKAMGAPASVVAKTLDAKADGNVIGYPEIGRWHGVFLSPKDGHQYKHCQGVEDHPLDVVCGDE